MTHITQLSTVLVRVADQDRALEFYTGTLGFEKLVDFGYAGGARWIEVAPPGAATSLSLARGTGGEETGVAFDSADVEADHAALRARGVDVDEAILREGDSVVHWAGAVLAGIPPMFRLRDPDGNSLLVVQQP
jgi:catechol 2,3-dioxygenase-like lactoylglutathione lyase family enzyme